MVVRPPVGRPEQSFNVITYLGGGEPRPYDFSYAQKIIPTFLLSPHPRLSQKRCRQRWHGHDPGPTGLSGYN